MRIDSATDDTIRVSLTVAIRFTDASVNRYTPIVHTGRCRAARSVFYCMFSLTHQQLLFILKLSENLVFLAAAMFAWCISPGAQFDIC